MILTTQQANAVQGCADLLALLGLDDAQVTFVFPEAIQVVIDTKVGPQICVWCRNIADCAVYPDVAALAKAYNLP